jgi:hypothetical protein
VRFLPWLISALLSVIATAPGASARERGLLLGYQAPPECPSRDHFWGQLWARSARLRWMRPDELTITVNARIFGGDSRYVGRLRLVDSVGAVVERDVAGPTCWDVGAALALITAVSLDAMPFPWLPTNPVPPRQEKEPKRVSIGPTLGIHKAVAPQVVPTLGLSATYRYPYRLGSPELRFEALVSLDKERPVFVDTTRVGSARFLWMSTRWTACALQLNLANTTLGPCVLFELGRLRGSGKTQTGGTSSDTGWWLAPGAVLNWSLQADPLRVRFAGGAVRPLVRDTFKFNPDPVALRPPSLGLIAEFELAWAF